MDFDGFNESFDESNNNNGLTPEEAAKEMAKWERMVREAGQITVTIELIRIDENYYLANVLWRFNRDTTFGFNWK